MISFEEIKQYLPQYLSASSQAELFNELKQFPNNLDKRIYSSRLKTQEDIFQGDGIQDLLYINFPDIKISKVPGMILSNTCSINPSNERFMDMRIVYAPIINLEKYEKMLIKDFVEKEKKSLQAINSHIEDIKKQYISHIFYLPKGERLENDSIVFFDRLTNCTSESIKRETLPSQRIFTLSDYGFYLFLFKLSVHFTRIREDLSRSNN